MTGAALALSIAMTLSSAPKELGDIKFGRDLDAALQQSKRSDKPVLILFDEIPGCSTCTGYGETVLKHPLIVEAAETLFVPVAIYNNQGGKDREALDYFKEPSWNNPVVRIVDSERNTIAPRVNGEYTPAGLARAMVLALQKANKPVPGYLALFADEAAAEVRGTERAVFSMYCFWSGEACLGTVEGVVATRTGFYEGHEVVEVEFDPTRITYDALVSTAQAKRCGDPVAKKAIIRGSEKDDKYQLTSTPYRSLTMTPLQATKLNSLIAAGGDPASILSPRQLASLNR